MSEPHIIELVSCFTQQEGTHKKRKSALNCELFQRELLFPTLISLLLCCALAQAIYNLFIPLLNNENYRFELEVWMLDAVFHRCYIHHQQ